uniref:Serine carboxypeptidase S28 family protein n=1 Tax=Salix viminalis TaxID=40686 RepID=A0A6N2LB34_SALVM
MTTLKLVFISLLLLSVASHASLALRTQLHSLSESSNSNNYLTTQELWFNQTLDHFSPFDHHKFPQRYYEFLDYLRIPDGPIFLEICGESSCNGIVNDYISVLAKKFGAAVVSLEHRYYGRSLPFESTTTENLRYLSSKQALFDLAVFRQYYQESLNLKLNRTSVENPWFVFGGSYAGALSAWFRLKFPHLTCGSLASSAVVLAIQNFTEFDQQIGDSAGAECKAALQETTKLVEERLASNKQAVKTLFDAAELEIDGDFLYFLADAAVIAFQYGNPDRVCSTLVKAKNSGDDLVEAYAKYVKDYYLGTFGSSVQTYNQKYLKDTSLNKHTGDRLWWFQVCTEVAYFQVAPSNDSIRSSKVDTRYHLDLCKNVFGEDIYPEVDATNIYYGGTNISGSKIVFANGSQDPWRHASKQTSSPDMPSFLISCHNCGHCTDMRGCPQTPLSLEGNARNCSSPEAVEKGRKRRQQLEEEEATEMMKLALISTFLFFLLFSTSHAHLAPQLWFNQTLDHYSPLDHHKFQQRYYEFLDYFRVPDGPIFLKICGESSCDGIANDYIGESLNLKLNRTGVENPWFVFGVSYSGALSAWFRLKFPHLTCGSLASSAVVLAVYNYSEFDQQIGESAGAECKAALQETTQLVEERLASNKKAVKTLFGAAGLEIDGDFLYFLADAAAIAVCDFIFIFVAWYEVFILMIFTTLPFQFQYGNPDKLCPPLVQAKKDGEDLVEVYAKYVKEYYVGNFGVSIQTYDQRHLKDTTLNENTRLWWFQVCTEVAYFQVAPTNDSIRSSQVDSRYHLDLCKKVFGEDIYPEVDTTNLYYGGTNIAGSKIIFTNGSQDPWRHASKQISSPDMPSFVMSCHNCGHGTDMRGCPQDPFNIEGNAKNCGSPDAVEKVRHQIIEKMDLWLSECHASDV